jgi:aerobic carbon-monoxide dehydrogenase medium subunit
MKPAPFTYHDPKTTAEAAGLLGSLDNARVLAGGQSLMPMMNFRYVMPDHIIDINGIAELSYIRTSGDTLAFGAMTRQRDIEFSDEVKAACPIVTEALHWVGHRQTRNRGTIGGSICHMDPSAELVAVTALLDGTLTALSKTGERKIAMAEFGQGFMTTALTEGEMLTGITLPLWPKGHGYAYEEFARRHGDFAIAASGCLVEVAGGSIKRASIVVSGVRPNPVRLTAAEKALVGQPPSDKLAEDVAAEAGKIDAMEDAYVTADYRKHLGQVMVKRALKRAFARATGAA